MRTRLLLLAAFAAAGCSEIDGPQVLGGYEIPAATLERGRRLYLRNCAPCHGEGGDGRGPAGVALWPPPRDFRDARFKFAGVEDRGLPHDDELLRIVRGGLPGTAMLVWDIPDSEARDIIDYIKTFSRQGEGFRDPDLAVSKPAIPADPFAGAPAQARAAAAREGERIYHETFQCAKCHPAYATGYEGLRGVDPFEAIPKWSENYDAVLLPTDFLRHRMRSVRVGPGGAEPADLYRAIAYGLQGPMPGYKHLGDDAVWKVVYYTKSLADRRGTAAGRALRDRLIRR
jgi:mono/diheme cytochrome c family protein